MKHQLLLLAMLVGAFPAKQASACAAEGPWRLHGPSLPENGATEVPLNARVIIFLTAHSPPPREAYDVVLSASGGEQLAVLQPELEPKTLVLDLDGQLAPSESYVLSFPEAPGYVGGWPGAESEDGFWRDDLRFTTGTQRDEEVPMAGEVAARIWTQVDACESDHDICDPWVWAPRAVNLSFTADSFSDDHGAFAFRLWQDGEPTGHQIGNRAPTPDARFGTALNAAARGSCCAGDGNYGYRCSTPIHGRGVSLEVFDAAGNALWMEDILPDDLSTVPGYHLVAFGPNVRPQDGCSSSGPTNAGLGAVLALFVLYRGRRRRRPRR